MPTELIGTGEVIDDETWSFVREELKTGWQAQASLVAGRQARIAQANDRLEHAWIEGLGQHVASIDSFAYADWERRNPGITGDKDWLHGLLRDNPECRVKSRSAKTQVSFAGLDCRPAGLRDLKDQETKRPKDSGSLKSEISNLKCGEAAAA